MSPIKPTRVCRLAVTFSQTIIPGQSANVFFGRTFLLSCLCLIGIVFQAKSQNRALAFNGSTQYVSTTQYLVPTSGDFTVELWVYATAGGLRDFVSQGTASTAFYIGTNATSNIWLGDTWPATTVAMPLNQWTHLAVVRSGTTGSFYLNGQLMATTPNYSVGAGGTPFYIGKQYGAISEYTSGSLDEIRVWNTARTASQIKQGLYGDVPVNSGNLLAYYKMNEGSGTTLFNNSTSTAAVASSNGSLLNGTQWLASSPVLRSDNGIHFDGDDDFLHTPATTAYDFASGTIECWVRTENLVGNACIIGSRTNPNTRYSFHISSTGIGMWNSLSYNVINTTITPGQWYHLAFVLTSTTTTIYVNGVSIGTTGNVYNASKTNLQLQVGVADFETGLENFSGSIDDIRIWNTVRTPTEIQTNMNTDLTGSEPNLIGYWNFNQGTPGGNNTGLIKAIDQTTGNRHLQLYNMGLSSNASNWVSHSTATLNPAPVITSFTPISGPVGTSIIISGNNFNTTPINNTVYLGATRATVTAASTTSLTVTAPAGSTYRPISVRNSSYGLTGYSGSSFLATYSGGGGTPAFDTKTDFATGINPNSVVFGDIDGNGKTDMVVLNGGSNTLSVYRNISSSGAISAGSFDTKVDFTTVASPYKINLSDVDGDGKLDIVTSNTGINSISVFRNNATSGSITSSSLDARVDFALGFSPKSVTLADIDRDGKPEVITATANGIGILPNTATAGSISSGSFGSPVYLASGNAFQSITTADLDGDQKPDIIAGGDATGLLSILQNVHSSGAINISSFSTKVDLSIGLNNPESIAIGDLDADGRLDILVPNTAENNISVFKNISAQPAITTGSFATQVKYTTGATPLSVAISDITGDGKPDMVVSNSVSNNLSVLVNAATAGVIDASSFSLKRDFVTGVLPGSLSAGDLDGDAKPDLAVINLSGTSVSVLHNATSNLTLPLALLSFTGKIVGTDALLNWKTDREINTKDFDIERSLDGRNFIVVGTVHANNTAGIQQYTFTDADILDLNTPALYYRLKQRDIDGRATYSFAIKLQLATKANSLQLYPTIVTNQAVLYLTLDKNEKVQLSVIDNNGRVVKSNSHQLTAGTTSLPIDVSNLAPGIYNLKVDYQGTQEIKRFIKK